jgi:hypothetical protein
MIFAAFAFGAAAAEAQACCMTGTGPGPSRPPVAVAPPAPPPVVAPTAPVGCGAQCSLKGPIVHVPGVTASPPHIYSPGVIHGGVNVVTNSVVSAVVAPSIHHTAHVHGGHSTVVVRSGGYAPVGDAMAVQSLGPVVAEREIESFSERQIRKEDLAAIRAICLDDKGSPHPASQVFAGETVPDGYQGELFRCMAGTRMEITRGRIVDGKPVFDGGANLSCAKNEALIREGAELVCRTQLAKRPCNERSLLRRFGPGIKIVRTETVETVRERQVRREVRELGAGMTMDGGVGQGVY